MLDTFTVSTVPLSVVRVKPLAERALTVPMTPWVAGHEALGVWLWWPSATATDTVVNVSSQRRRTAHEALR